VSEAGTIGRRAEAAAWRTARITALSDLLSPSRLYGLAIRLGVQLFLVAFLWRALYAHVTQAAGLTETQAVSYALLAVLVLRIRRADRWMGRDMVIQHVQSGTIVYWFLRPVSPQRYSLWRGVGEQAYGLAWAVAGWLVCLAIGVVGWPASAGDAAAFAVTFILGQSVLYYLGLLTDLMCFWTIRNGSVVAILAFAQNLLSGGYAALWYYPGWFRSVSEVLPFQYTVGVPLSFYIGRLPLAELPLMLGWAAAWMLALALVTRLLWRRAAARISAQGG
jgi:ABC-2 type transport system permease protein